jgi:hypothetical protein
MDMKYMVYSTANRSIKTYNAVDFHKCNTSRQTNLVTMKPRKIKSSGMPVRQEPGDLFKPIAALINQSRQKVMIAVNSELLQLYWSIGNIIKKSVLQNKRAAYGEQIISLLSKRLTASFGSGWSKKQLDHCLRTAETIELDSYKDNYVPAG